VPDRRDSDKERERDWIKYVTSHWPGEKVSVSQVGHVTGSLDMNLPA